ncbi:hypothetical protein [Streptomyces sparsus]
MRVGTARRAAADWVARYAAGEPGYRGAFFSGSTVGRPDAAALPVTSDVDVVVLTAGNPPGKPGKVRYRGVLLEVTWLPWSDVASAERVLGDYHLAGSFRCDTVIDDPTGHLGGLHTQVSRRFADRTQVRRRCADARSRITIRLAALDGGAPLHESVTGWLFATGVTTHVLLVAALRNPTVRLRYVRVREALDDHGESALYPRLLDLLGCGALPREAVRRHLEELATTFDLTVPVARTPFFFSNDLTSRARPVAIGGSRELVDTFQHREAVFWIVATFARCHTVLAADAPRLHRARLPAFRAVLADLGIGAATDLLLRAEQVTGFLPELDRAAERVMSRHPDVVG